MQEVITFRMLAHVDLRKLPTLKRDIQENVNMFNETIRGVIGETKDFVEKGEYVARYTQDRHRNTFIVAASVQILTFQCRLLVNDANQQCISQANIASIMQDAMASLVYRSLPIALIPSTIFANISYTIDLYGLSEAIPGKLIAAKTKT